MTFHRDSITNKPTEFYTMTRHLGPTLSAADVTSADYSGVPVPDLVTIKRLLLKGPDNRATKAVLDRVNAALRTRSVWEVGAAIDASDADFGVTRNTDLP